VDLMCEVSEDEMRKKPRAKSVRQQVQEQRRERKTGSGGKTRTEEASG